MDKINTESEDLIKTNIENLKTIFPEAFISGKINFDTLQELLGEELEESNERFGLQWRGKQTAKRIVNQKTTSTLHPVKDESVDWDKTKNIFIEGDNLEVLKIMQSSYKNQIKMIYIDPPYNTGKDFVYADNFNDNLQNYLEYTGQLDDKGKKLSTNPETSGRYHDNWLNMMYPRLKLARNLLTEDGVIFISIDDSEITNLKYLCDEVFGSDNFILNGPTIMNLKGNQDEFAFAGTHEYTLIYAKNKSEITFNQFELEDDSELEWEEDEKGFYKKGANLKSTGGNAPRDKRPNLFYPIFITNKNQIYVTENNIPLNQNDYILFPITSDLEMSWRWSKEKVQNEIYDIILNGDKENGFSLNKKQRPTLGDLPSKKPKSIFYKPEYSSGNGTNEFNKVLNVSFGTEIRPKPLKLIKDFISLSTDKKSIVLDFFAGSGTTAQATMELNSYDGGDRKFICVQLPEPLIEGKIEQKESLEFCKSMNLPFNISSITKERIKNSSINVSKENPLESSEMDLGFRVYKLGDTNFSKWNKNIESKEQLILELDAVEELENLDVDSIFYETLLKEGVDLALSTEFEIVKLGENQVLILNNSLIICLENEIKFEMFNEILKLKIKPLKVICLEIGLIDDQVKINAKHLMDNNDIKFKTI
jgi:adenine-specific DNA-methyltransferase